MSIIIGLTGPTGSGKSSASREAAALGFKVIDCDRLARAAVEKGNEGLKAVVSAFGDDILNTDGTLNRRALAAKAFATPQNTKLLNDTLFPFITALVDEEILSADKILLDAPTLFESGINARCDSTVAVLAHEEIRLGRIIARDNIDISAAKLRISAGKDEGFYKQNADFIIYNNGDETAFISEFKKIIAKIMGKIN